MFRFSLYISIITWLIACQQRTKSTGIGEVSTDSLQVQLTSLTDSLDTTWKEMIASDDQKIMEVGRLLANIQEGCKLTGKDWASLGQQQQTLANKRYKSPDDMRSEQIDQYDAATDSLLQNLDVFYERNTITACCTTCDGLREEIKRRHSDVVMFRIRYDSHAREYNALVTQQKENLKRINAAYGNLKPRSLFSLMQ